MTREGAILGSAAWRPGRSARRNRNAFLATLAAAAAPLARSQLVGPGGVVPYGAGGSGRRVSYGVVRDASNGFFVGGSSIDELNGVYERVAGLPRKSNHVGIHYKDGSLTYFNEASGWHMAMVDASPDDGTDPGVDETGKPRRKTASVTEWLFIDEEGKDRFRHEGETILPGSGTSWTHVAEKKKKDGIFGEAAELLEEYFPVANPEDTFVDLDELPWQVIGVMDPDMLHRLKYHKRYHTHTVRQALSGNDLPSLPSGDMNSMAFVSLDSEMPTELHEKYFSLQVILSPPEDAATTTEDVEDGAELGLSEDSKKATAADQNTVEYVLSQLDDSVKRIRGGLQEGASFYQEAVDVLQNFLSGVLYKKVNNNADVHSPRNWPSILAWVKAGCLQLQSFFLRRVGAPVEQVAAGGQEQQDLAGSKMSEALAMFPRWNAGLLENAMIFFDKGEAGKARHFLEQILRAKRDFPELPEWLLIAHTHDKRKWEAETEFPASKFGGLLENAEADPSKDSPQRKRRGAKIESPGQYMREKSNFYRLLGVPVDFVAGVEDDLLKKQYRQLSKHTHPDKHGSEYKELFQKIAKAYETLSNPTRRPAYDEGSDLDSLQSQHQVEDEDGHKQATMKEEISKNYFPERNGFHPFGDPFERKKREGYGETYSGYKKVKKPIEYADKIPLRYSFPMPAAHEGEQQVAAGSDAGRMREDL